MRSFRPALPANSARCSCPVRGAAAALWAASSVPAQYALSTECARPFFHRRSAGQPALAHRSRYLGRLRAVRRAHGPAELFRPVEALTGSDRRCANQWRLRGAVSEARSQARRPPSVMATLIGERRAIPSGGDASCFRFTGDEGLRARVTRVASDASHVACPSHQTGHLRSRSSSTHASEKHAHCQ